MQNVFNVRGLLLHCTGQLFSPNIHYLFEN